MRPNQVLLPHPSTGPIVAITERWKCQFRAESFSLTDTPHFANSGFGVESTSFMIISSTTGADANLEGQAQ